MLATDTRNTVRSVVCPTACPTARRLPMASQSPNHNPRVGFDPRLELGPSLGANWVPELRRKATKPETDGGASRVSMWPICRGKAIGTNDQGLLAMQKVEGSSPFSRSSRKPRKCGVFAFKRWSPAGREQTKRAQIGHSAAQYPLRRPSHAASVPVGLHIARCARGCLDMAPGRFLWSGTAFAATPARRPASQTKAPPKGRTWPPKWPRRRHR